MFTRVHHINLLVRDIEAAVEQYRQVLGVEDFFFGDISARGVRTARFRAGESWIVLVQPTDDQGVPAQYLAEHGEGLFLLSLEVDDLEDTVAQVRSRGGQFTADKPRQGLEGWQVIDLDAAQFNGAQLQLVQE